MRAPRFARVVILAGLLLPGASQATTTDAERARRAEALYEEALERLDRDTIEDRRQGILRLEEATLLAPRDARFHLALARAYYRAGFIKNARTRYERVSALDPQDPDSQFGMGEVWRRDWLKFLDPTSLASAIEHFSKAARTRPEHCDTWLQLVPLHVERGELAAARAAAERALLADARRPEAELALAHAAYRQGEVERAERLFTRSIPRLPLVARERFEDIAPVASEQDTVELHRLPFVARAAFVNRFWQEHDPDLTTELNEAQVEYWSRVAQAYFLFFDRRRGEWDQRGEVYVRYGPPERAEYNPLGSALTMRMGSVGSYPMNLLVWHYPSLGMTVTMQDRLLTERYMLPLTREYDPDPRPDPAKVGDPSGTLASRQGRGVFPLLPPGARAIDLAATVAHFESEGRPGLLAQVESPGTPAESLWGAWAVLDSAQQIVARGGRTLAPSACDPAALRAADFTTGLPPGRYTVGLSVRDGRGGRGVVREETEVLPLHPALTLSDIVVSCGVPVPGATSVRPEPNPAARVRGMAPLVAYFEIYRLAKNARGLARFEYVYTVTSAATDERIWIQRLLAPRNPPPPISASRQETHAGEVRRQFVTVPVQQLPPGRYRLEIRVRDLEAGTVASGNVEFEREAAQAGS